MIPPTTHRVPLHTADRVNAEIRRRTRENVARYADPGAAAITARLQQLDREWDVERALEANASLAVLTGVALGAMGHRKWFYFPAVVGGFLLLHAIEGWCPPLPVFRRLGFRTAAEIEEERYALKVLRGDFRTAPTVMDAQDREAMERMEGEGPAHPATIPGPAEQQEPLTVVLEAVKQ